MPRRRVSLIDGYRQGTHLIHGLEGYSYYYNREMKGGRISMECIFYRKSCHGRASCDGQGYEFRQTQRHNHRPNWYLVHERRFRSAVLDRCRRGDTNPLHTIYEEERLAMRVPRPAAANVTFPLLCPSMQRAREKSLPPQPHNLSELDKMLRDPKYSPLVKTLDGLDSIYAGAAGSTGDGTKCLVFISRRMRIYMQDKVHKLFCDATFCITPRNMGCAQVWNLVTIRRHHVIAIGSILMQRKSVPCYRTAIQAIKTLVPNFRPRRIMCDYESSEQKAFALEYPNVERSGCLFHADKAMLSKAKEMGLVPYIRGDDKCETIVRSLCALPLLPHDRIVAGLVRVGEFACQHGWWDRLAAFFDYVRRTWLRPSILPIFSVYDCEDRTSNGNESYNNTMQKALGQLAHPNVYYLISGLNRLEDRYTQDLHTLVPGGSVGRNRKLSAAVNDSLIKGLKEDLEEGNIDELEFLTQASLRVQTLFETILQLQEKE